MFAYSFALIERAKAELALVKADLKGVTALEYGLLAGLIAVRHYWSGYRARHCHQRCFHEDCCPFERRLLIAGRHYASV